MAAIAPSASAIRDRILDAARDHVPLEHEDADALVALLDKLITLESKAEPARHWSQDHVQQMRESLKLFPPAAVSAVSTPVPIIVRLDAGNAAEASTIFRALAKALKPKKPSRKG